MQGAAANSISDTIPNPPIAAVYVERVGSYSVADLSFEIGLADGSLLPRGPQGGSFSAVGAAVDPEGRIARRKPGSLLLFPEFDSRGGMLTLLTVTNTDPVDDVRAHFVYYGKFGGQNWSGLSTSWRAPRGSSRASPVAIDRRGSFTSRPSGSAALAALLRRHSVSCAAWLPPSRFTTTATSTAWWPAPSSPRS